MPSLQSVCILIPCFLLLYSSQKPACFSISRDCQMFSHRSDICFHGIYCYASRVFLVCFLGTDQNWSSFDVVVVHPLFVYTQQDTKINPSGEVRHAMAAVLPHSYSVETDWCHGNSRGEDAWVGTVLDGLLCTALALLYLWRCGDVRLQQCSC